ncbi:PAS domain-containing protein [Stutzerimonas stutzeri]|uniref:PAS domain-containing protein n=1 Tax=Stutzerimonas stutzeri TaxID=316 RepID=UPI0030131267
MFERIQLLGGRRRVLFGALMDVTELKAADSNLADEKRRYERMVDGLPDGVLMLRQGRIHYANAAARRLLAGDPLQPLNAQPFLDFVAEHQRAREAARLEAFAAEPARAIEPPPRFSLQLLRAGNVLLVVELPTGESFQSRDPAYILLKDLLRAARLPDKPQQVGDGEPIRWPLLHKGSLDQGAEAARDYVQGVMAAELEQMGCDCIWLIGRPALRFAGEVDVDNCYREVAVEGLGRALAMPGLEALMEQPAAKAELWKAMRRSMPRWHIGS